MATKWACILCLSACVAMVRAQKGLHKDPFQDVENRFNFPSFDTAFKRIDSKSPQPIGVGDFFSNNNHQPHRPVDTNNRYNPNTRANRVNGNGYNPNLNYQPASNNGFNSYPRPNYQQPPSNTGYNPNSRPNSQPINIGYNPNQPSFPSGNTNKAYNPRSQRGNTNVGNRRAPLLNLSQFVKARLNNPYLNQNPRPVNVNNGHNPSHPTPTNNGYNPNQQNYQSVNPNTGYTNPQKFQPANTNNGYKPNLPNFPPVNTNKALTPGQQNYPPVNTNNYAPSQQRYPQGNGNNVYVPNNQQYQPANTDNKNPFPVPDFKPFNTYKAYKPFPSQNSQQTNTNKGSNPISLNSNNGYKASPAQNPQLPANSNSGYKASPAQNPQLPANSNSGYKAGPAQNPQLPTNSNSGYNPNPPQNPQLSTKNNNVYHPYPPQNPQLPTKNNNVYHPNPHQNPHLVINNNGNKPNNQIYQPANVKNTLLFPFQDFTRVNNNNRYKPNPPQNNQNTNNNAHIPKPHTVNTNSGHKLNIPQNPQSTSNNKNGYKPAPPQYPRLSSNNNGYIANNQNYQPANFKNKVPYPFEGVLPVDNNNGVKPRSPQYPEQANNNYDNKPSPPQIPHVENDNAGYKPNPPQNPQPLHNTNNVYKPNPPQNPQLLHNTNTVYKPNPPQNPQPSLNTGYNPIPPQNPQPSHNTNNVYKAIPAQNPHITNDNGYKPNLPQNPQQAKNNNGYQPNPAQNPHVTNGNNRYNSYPPPNPQPAINNNNGYKLSPSQIPQPGNTNGYKPKNTGDTNKPANANNDYKPSPPQNLFKTKPSYTGTLPVNNQDKVHPAQTHPSIPLPNHQLHNKAKAKTGTKGFDIFGQSPFGGDYFSNLGPSHGAGLNLPSFENLFIEHLTGPPPHQASYQQHRGGIPQKPPLGHAVGKPHPGASYPAPTHQTGTQPGYVNAHDLSKKSGPSASKSVQSHVGHTQYDPSSHPAPSPAVAPPVVPTNPNVKLQKPDVYAPDGTLANGKANVPKQPGSSSVPYDPYNQGQGQQAGKAGQAEYPAVKLLSQTSVNKGYNDNTLPNPDLHTAKSSSDQQTYPAINQKNDDKNAAASPQGPKTIDPKLPSPTGVEPARNTVPGSVLGFFVAPAKDSQPAPSESAISSTKNVYPPDGQDKNRIAGSNQYHGV